MLRVSDSIDGLRFTVAQKSIRLFYFQDKHFAYNANITARKMVSLLFNGQRRGQDANRSLAVFNERKLPASASAVVKLVKPGAER
jgi:hypothetical protein